MKDQVTPGSRIEVARFQAFDSMMKVLFADAREHSALSVQQRLATYGQFLGVKCAEAVIVFEAEVQSELLSALLPTLGQTSAKPIAKSTSHNRR